MQPEQIGPMTNQLWAIKSHTFLRNSKKKIYTSNLKDIKVDQAPQRGQAAINKHQSTGQGKT